MSVLALLFLPLSAALAAPPAFPPGSPLKDVKVREVMPRIYHLEFPTRRLLAETFMRFQEHYESAEFHGKVFTKTEFLAAYAKVPHGTKSDYFEWDGFNLPSVAFKRFYAGEFDPLDAYEKDLLALLSGFPGDFYVIATDGGSGTLQHEIAHGLYATNSRYRDQARVLLKGADMKPAFAMLKRLGYHRSVWEDEAHAWLGEEPESLKAEGLDPEPYRALRGKLLALYARHRR